MPHPLQTKAESLLLRSLLGLPPVLLRRLAGRPVVVDGNTLELELQVLLRLQHLTRNSGLAKRTVAESRAGMKSEALVVGGDQPIGSAEDLVVDGAAGPLDARLYVPTALLHDPTPSGLLVYFHGGGWALGDLDSHDATCRFLAERADVRVLSVAYRLAPEDPYPAGPDDAFASLRWAVDHSVALGADPDRIAVGGDSAGGALAALAAIEAAEAGLPLRLQLLIYPATRIGESGPSRDLFGAGYVLTDESMTVFEQHYLGDQERSDPGHSVGYRDTFPEGLAPTVIAIAGFDPLRDEERDYVELLEKAGLPVTERFYPGLTHGFANMVGIGRACPAAVCELAADLRRALA